MASTFSARMAQLRDRVGHGDLEGSVEVNQVYAHYQHEGVEFRHPLGGQAKFLEAPLYDHAARYMQDIADRMLEEGPQRPMIEAMEDLSDRVLELSPVEFGDLRDSGHPVVLDQGDVIYDRQPVAHRQSKEELAAKAELLETGLRLRRRSDRSITEHHNDFVPHVKGSRKDAALKRARRDALRTGSALTRRQRAAQARRVQQLRDSTGGIA